MTTTSTQHTGVDRERWKFTAATLAVLGLTSTVVQEIAFAYYGLGGHVPLRWSTGELVALLGAIYMGYEARSWARWKRIIRVWIAITAFIVGIVSYHVGVSVVQPGASSSAEVETIEGKSASSGFGTPPAGDEAIAAEILVMVQEIRELTVETLGAFLDEVGHTEPEIKEIFRELIARGDTEEEILGVLDEMYWEGDMSEYQYCVMTEWYTEVAYDFQPLSREELISNGTDWIIKLRTLRSPG